jgi:tRNA(Arg) A34 adenosine deaminase TadA
VGVDAHLCGDALTAWTPSTSMNGPAPSGRDLELLRETISLAVDARARGRHPFGALVADRGGRVIVRGGNDSLPPDGDPTRHAELIVAAAAARSVGTGALARSTLYSSAEPCCMCAGAIYWCGIGRVVYGLSERRLLDLTGDHPENPTLSLPCREVLARGQRRIEVVGPLIEDEAEGPHIGFWERPARGAARPRGRATGR